VSVQAPSNKMSGVFGGGPGVGGSGRNDKSLSLGLLETMRLAWADPDLRARITFVLVMFAVFALGTHVPVPIPGINTEVLGDSLLKNPTLSLLNVFGGGALRRLSILAMGLGPYITASIIIQVLTTAFPTWKKELQEGGEYARRAQNKRTRALTLVLCAFQGFGREVYNRSFLDRWRDVHALAW
jgi:preprotein translocase subunit SecY